MSAAKAVSANEFEWYHNKYHVDKAAHEMLKAVAATRANGMCRLMQ